MTDVKVGKAAVFLVFSIVLAFMAGCTTQEQNAQPSGQEIAPAHAPDETISTPSAEAESNGTETVLNTAEAEQSAEPEHSESEVQFLIISSGDFMDTAYRLEERREAGGLATYVKNASELNTTGAWDVAGWVYSYKMSHPNLKYLLLLGDVDSIPTFYYNDDEVDYRIEGDYDYSFPRDDVPTLAVGRVPARNSTEAERWMNKLVAYEDHPPAKSVLLFGFSHELDSSIEPHGTALESSGFTVSVLNSSSAAQVSERLNSGLGFAIFYGHGTYYSLTPVFTASDIRRLDNSDKPFILLSGGCDAQGYAESNQAISELLVTDEDGAVAVIGATRRGGFGYEYVFVPHFFEECRNVRLGDAFIEGLRGTRIDWLASTNPQLHGNRYEESRQFMERFVILGDPTTKICQN